MAQELTVKDFRSYLRIDADGLDECLMEQPDLYYQVAENYARVVAERDAAKLNVDELSAQLDQKYRAEAVESDTKITEAQMQNKVRSAKPMMEAQRELATLKLDADSWAAMKEAFSQRSFMLRELVSLHIARLRELSMERSSGVDRNQLADTHREVAGRQRASEPRFTRRTRAAKEEV